MGVFSYPSGTGSMFPSGFTTPSGDVGLSLSFEATSGNLSSESGMVYPVAVPRLDSGAQSGLEYYLPYSAQMFSAAMSGIKEEYIARGATEPVFYAYFDSSGTVKEEITSYSGLLSMPLANFHMTIRDCYTAISGLVCMSGWEDDMTDYMRRVFDYRVMLKNVPSGNRLQNNVTYFNLASGSNVTINPLDRARSGLFPLSLDDVKYVGTKWGVDPSGNRNYGSEVFGATGVAASPGSGIFPSGDRDPLFTNSNFMGHYDWLAQSIMWRGPFVETFSKDTGSDSVTYINLNKNQPYDVAMGHDDDFRNGRGLSDTSGTSEASGMYVDTFPATPIYPTVEKTATNQTTTLEQYVAKGIKPSPTGTATFEAGYQPLNGIDYGDLAIKGPSCVRGTVNELNKGDTVEASGDRRDEVRADLSFISEVRMSDLIDSPDGPLQGLPYEEVSPLRIPSTHASDSSYTESFDYCLRYNTSNGQEPNSVMFPIFEEITASRSTSGLRVEMKDWFGCTPGSAYGSFSGYVTSDGPVVDGGVAEPDFSIPVARAGYERVSKLGSGFTIPSKVDPTPTNFQYWGNPTTSKAGHFSGIVSGVSHYVLTLREGTEYKWGRQWNYWGQYTPSQYTESHISGWNRYSDGNPVYSIPFQTFNLGGSGRFGVNGIDTLCQSAGSPGGGLLFNMTSAEYDAAFSDFVEYSGNLPSSGYHAVEMGPSGYTPTYHPMQTTVELKKSLASVSGYSYPIGSGSQAILDVDLDSRPALPADVSGAFGRGDWQGLHLCLTSNKHLPDDFRRSSSGAYNTTDYSVNVYPGQYKAYYEFAEEQFLFNDINPGTQFKLGISPIKFSDGVSTKNWSDEEWQLFDASGRLHSNVTTRYKTPSVVQSYFTRGGYSTHLVSQTQLSGFLTDAPEYVNGTSENRPAPHADISGIGNVFNGKQCYTVYGDGNYIFETGGHESGVDRWQCTKDLFDMETNGAPSGMHYTILKVDDFSPSGTTYTVDIWDQFKSDMDNLTINASGGYFGTTWDSTLSPTVLSLSSSVNNMSYGFAGLAPSGSGFEGMDPAFGILNYETQGVELTSLALVDAALSEEGTSRIPAGGTGYTLRSIRLKFPVILGPSGLQ